MKRAEKKVVVVTGGASGIGRETCLLLAKEGAKVAVIDIHDKEGQELVKEINKSGGVAKYWHLDVSNEKEVEKVYKEVYETFGQLNATVNNAGVSGADKPTHELTEEEWDFSMNINVKGVFFCTKHAVSYLKKSGGGSIVNLSSVYGIVGAGDVPHYHAAKGAVRTMSKNDAIIYAKDNIRVNSLHPGFVLTPMVKNFIKDTPGMMDYLVSLHPIGRLGNLIEIAYGILFLISDESSFMTGSEMVIDGGYTCK